LYSFNEEPFVEIDATFPGHLNLVGCHRVDPGGRKWVVPGAISSVTGTLECQELVVELNIPVYRARLYYKDGKPVRYILLTELEHEVFFLLTGTPEASGWLGLWQQPERQMPVDFESSGMVRVSSSKLLELVRNSSYSINEVVINAGEHTVSTGAVIINLASVTSSVCAGIGYQACVCTAGNLTRILDICTEICRGVAGGRRYNLNRIPKFHPSLDGWIFSLFACVGIFDEVDILVSGKNFDWTECVINEQLRRLLDFIIQARIGRWTGLSVPAAEKELLPSVDRWQNALNQLLLVYMNGEEVLDLSEWAGEIRRHFFRYRSGIARFTGGQLLSKAWVYYRCNLFEKAIANLNIIKEGPPLITELRDFLHILLFLRLARMKSARTLIASVEPGRTLETVFLLLQYTISIFHGEMTRERPKTLTGLLAQLPLRSEDETFLEQAARAWNNPEDVEANPPDTNDWLLLWFFANLCTNQQKKAELAWKLLQHGDRIPASPEKTEILDRLMKLAEVK
jgi:hypothetical protein